MPGVALPLGGLFIAGGTGLRVRWDEASLAWRMNNEAVGALTFVFRPNAPALAAENIYADWATLYAALNIVQGDRIVQIDDTFQSPVVIPAGVYDLTGVSFVGRLETTFQTPLRFADGAVLLGCAGFSNGLEVHSDSSSPVLSAAAGKIWICKLEYATFLEADGAAPFVHVDAGGIFLFACSYGSGLRTGAQAVVDVDAGGAFLVAAFLNTTIQADVCSGLGQLEVQLWDAASVFDPTQSAHGGPTNLSLGEQSSLVKYDPTTPSGTSWKPNPTTVQEGLDRMAAAVAGLLGGPIL